MAFSSDADPIEEILGARCEYFTPDQLVAYVVTFHQAHGRKLAVSRHAEHQIFQQLQGRYGRRDAGRIVKWAFYAGGPHRGEWKGKPIGIRDFAPGSAWWTDQLHWEMQDHLKKERAAVTPVDLGFSTLADF